MNIAVVTGASSGLGKEFVLQIDSIEKLDEIWVISRRKDRLETLIGKTASSIRVISGDLTDPSFIDRYVSLLDELQPTVKYLVNASGYGKFGNYNDIPVEQVSNMIDLNCKSLVCVTERSLKYMTEGSVIFEIASIAAFQPIPYLNVYAASKAFVLSYSRALNRELKPRRITVTAVCPGWMKTEFIDVARTTGNKITHFNRFLEPSSVVSKALSDGKKGKDVSTYGFLTNIDKILEKLLPHSLIMNIWEHQQKFN